MKILFSNSALSFGGAERVISIVASKLAEMGHEVEVLLYYDKEVCYKLNKKVRVISDEQYIGKSNILNHIIWRRKYIKQQKPDVVISFLAKFNMLNIIAMSGLNIPLIVADRNDPRKVPNNFLLRKCRDWLYVFADGVVIQNKSNQGYFSKKVIDKSTVIYNPIDLGDYLGAALKCSEKEKKIVCVARVIEQKNPLMLLRAFSYIAGEFPDYKLVYYGDGDMIREVSDAAQKMGLGDRVELCGAVENVFEHIKKAELFVLNSNYEGMPNALLEAMCLGLPVVCTRVSGAADVIDDGENGLLVDCGDVKDLEMAIRRMLKDDTFRKNCGIKAAKLNELVKYDYIVNEWNNFIVSVIHKK